MIMRGYSHTVRRTAALTRTYILINVKWNNTYIVIILLNSCTYYIMKSLSTLYVRYANLYDVGTPNSSYKI